MTHDNEPSEALKGHVSSLLHALYYGDNRQALDECEAVGQIGRSETWGMYYALVAPVQTLLEMDGHTTSEGLFGVEAVNVSTGKTVNIDEAGLPGATAAVRFVTARLNGDDDAAGDVLFTFERTCQDPVQYADFMGALLGLAQTCLRELGKRAQHEAEPGS